MTGDGGEPGLHIMGAAGPQAVACWLTVHPDGRVTVFAGKVEYGQGIRTGLAMEVADELRVALADVEVVLGDTDRVPWDMGTFGSMSTARVGLQLRKAAATARQALLELAADRLDLPAGDLAAREGRVFAASDGSRSVGYDELLAGGSLSRELMDDAPLTPAAEFTVMGRPDRRVDAVARVTGAAVYSRDVVVEGMLFGSVLRRPARHARLASVDTSLAERMPGVVQVVRDDNLVAVLAASDQQAEAAAALLQAEWEEHPDGITQDDLPEVLVRTGHDPFVTHEAGSLEEGFRAADHVLEADYFIPYISNCAMEPRAAVAQWEGDRLTVWAGSQRPFGVRAELAQALGIDETKVRVVAPEIGGGFGGKSMYPIAVEAARVARLAGRPVRLAYTRGEELAHATFRPAALIRVKSGFRADGTVVAWQFHAYHATDRPPLGRRGSETPYDVSNVNVTVFSSDSPLATGSFRSLGGAVNHFARETHMDEIAAAVGLDPLELRLRNLSQPRFRRVLQSAAERHGWTAAPALSHRGAGLALGLDVGSHAAICLQLHLEGSEVKVERVTAALDCGLTVNPEGAANQVEGSVVMGLSTALFEAIDFEDGRVLNNSMARYRIARPADAPAIEVLLVGDPEVPSTGAGEPAMVPVAAAVSNALFDLTGRRYRRLPLQKQIQ